ncbi:MAG: tyrosine--tRNA ligase, partial [Candidatus Yanofskybacteria bacterium]|nr:tyrosine--tRNA ligase [Candidatus Yanofskybacteria bacterium]
FPSKEKAAEMMGAGEQLVFYLGIDPTGPSIHLGHTIPLLALKQLAKLGHKIIILIGDFTAMIGDPTDKEAARKPLSEKEVKENMKIYLNQIYKILPKNSFEVKYNSKWYNKMLYKDWLKVAMKFTQQQMIARDMFQERLKKEKPIGMHEFDYPMMQGYDSVAMEVDGEVGGNDQTFNMLVGRDLVKEYLGKEKLVFATKLLVDAVTGKKISKTEGGFIAVSDLPEDVFGKTMKSIPDEMIKIVFELCTEKSQDWINAQYEEVKNGGNPKNFKEELAYELVRMYYGEKAAEKAKENFEKVFSEGQLPEEMQEFKFTGKIIELLHVSGLASSMGEAKRLIDQHAVNINGHAITDWEHDVKSGDVIKVGPRRFLKIK